MISRIVALAQAGLGVEFASDMGTTVYIYDRRRGCEDVATGHAFAGDNFDAILEASVAKAESYLARGRK